MDILRLHNLHFFVLSWYNVVLLLWLIYKNICFSGQSTITFIYDFVEEFKGPHPGYAVIDGHPPAGLNYFHVKTIK